MLLFEAAVSVNSVVSVLLAVGLLLLLFRDQNMPPGGYV